MKSLAACTIVLALAACGSSTNNATSGTGGSSTTGARSTGTSSGGRGSSTGTAAGSSTGSPLGSACDISGGTDPCTDDLLACSADGTTATTGVCQLPAQFDLAGDGGVPSGDLGDGGYGCQDGGDPNSSPAAPADLLCSRVRGPEQQPAMVELSAPTPAPPAPTAS